MSKLILISSSFPVYKNEPFLEKEYKYLSEKFTEINFIVISNKQDSFEVYEGVDLSKVKLINTQKGNELSAMFLSLFSLKFIKEIFYIFSKVKLRYFLRSLKIAIVSYNNAQKIVKIIKNDVLFSSTEKSIIYSYWCDDGAIAASLLKGHPMISKIITRVHGWDLNLSVHTPPYLPFRDLIQKSCDKISPISRKGKSIIASEWKVPTDNVVVSKLGVERQEFISKKDADIFTIVSCSNIIPLKRVQLIAESIVKIEKPIQWFHFGNGEELEAIEKYTGLNKKSNQKIVFFGEVNNHEVLDFYKYSNIDLFINVSTTEGIPFSIMEAMSFGIPCIATNVGGTSEIVNNENGYLLTENPSVEEIVFQIERFRSMNKEEYTKYSKNAYKTWEEEYNAEKNFTQFIKEILSH